MYFDDELIDDLVDDVASWNDFYIVCDNESEDLAAAIQDILCNHKISYNLIGDGMEYDFKEGDCLLTISRSGEGPILKVVEDAVSKNVRIYGLSNNRDSGLAFLCNELIIVDENQEMMLFATLNEKLGRYLNDDNYDVENATIMGPPSRVRRLFVTIVLWVVLILIIILIIVALMGYIM